MNNLVELIFSILFFVAMYLEYKKKPAKEQNAVNRSKAIKWFFISFGIVTVFAIYFVIVNRDINGFGGVLYIFQIFLYIAIITYFLVYAFDKYRSVSR